MSKTRPTSRRAMTLIELLVAIALLGMLAVMASLMWTQLRGWGGDTELAQRALRPHRVHLLMQNQWNARANAGEEQAPGRPRGSATQFSFLTAHPALHAHWPVVEATYTIQPATPDRPAQLVYTEKRLGPNQDTVASEAELETLILLDTVQSAAFRYRARVIIEEDSERTQQDLWIDTPEEASAENVDLLFTEFRAQSRREEVAWTAVAAPSL